MDIPFVFALICSVGSSVWWLGKQLRELEIKIDSINDQLREYRLINDTALTKQRDRITALKLNSQSAIEDVSLRINDVERFLNKTQNFQRRYFQNISTDTYSDSEEFFQDNDSWTEIK